MPVSWKTWELFVVEISVSLYLCWFVDFSSLRWPSATSRTDIWTRACFCGRICHVITTSTAQRSSLTRTGVFKYLIFQSTPQQCSNSINWPVIFQHHPGGTWLFSPSDPERRRVYRCGNGQQVYPGDRTERSAAIHLLSSLHEYCRWEVFNRNWFT